MGTSVQQPACTAESDGAAPSPSTARRRIWYSPAMSTQSGTKSVTVEEVPYGGWRRNLRLANGDAELIVTLDVGPRVIRYAAPGAPNLLGEAADQLGRAGEPGWMPRGGHRLWTAPEDPTRTYA